MSGSSSFPTDYRALLQEVASLYGMDAGYWDIWGRWHDAPDEARRAILESLGIACETAGQLREALERHLRGVWERATPPVIVASVAGQPIEAGLRVPAGLADAGLRLTVALEDGTERSVDGSLSDAAELERIDVGGTTYVHKKVRLPDNLPLGYHELRVEVEGGGALPPTRLIVCPQRAWLPDSLAAGGRRAGLAVSLYGVRDAHTWGCGDFTALRAIAGWVAEELGASYVAVNPLQAIHNRQPYNTSPYLPNSLLYRNFIYLDIDRIEEMRVSRLGSALRRHPRTLAEIEAVNGSEFVEYERVHTLKLRILRALFHTFWLVHWRGETPRGAAFRRYIDQEGESLDRYALYTALDEHLHRRNPDLWVWPDWPEEFRDPDSEAVRRFRDQHPRSILFYKYIQWQIDEQAAETQAEARARGMEIGLFHDLPLATDRCGFELWANRPFYVSGCRVGSPPDDFSPKGQDWSFPPPDIDKHRKDGYRRFAETVRDSARHGGALRIDHVMRLFRLYWIPDGFDATAGTYVRNHAEDLLGVLALESVRNRVLIVGEDLGTVEPHMRETLARFGVLSYRLLYFEKTPNGGFRLPAEYPAGALVSSTTHDLPTLAGFWAGRDIDLRRELGLLDEQGHREWQARRREEKLRLVEALVAAGLLPEFFDRSVADGGELTGELHNAVIGFLVSTPCALMTLNHEDLTKELDQQNLPGTTHQYPNWRRKMTHSVEELRTEPTARDFAAMFRNWLAAAGRKPAGSR